MTSRKEFKEREKRRSILTKFTKTKERRKINFVKFLVSWNRKAASGTQSK